MLYRLVDSLDEKAGGDQLRRIEMDIFHEKFKNKENNAWEGTEEQNLAADKSIAASIRSSLKYYEENPQGPGYKGSFFKFS